MSAVIASPPPYTPTPVILGLVPRTPVSAKLPPQGARGADANSFPNDSAAARGVLGTSPRMTVVGEAPGNVLVLRQAQDEDEFNDGSLETLILSLSKDEGFSAPPFEQAEARP